MTTLLEINSWTECIDDVYASPVQTDDEDAMSNHAFRSPDSLWKEYGLACKAKGSSRSDDLRRYMTAEVAAYRRAQRRANSESAD